MSPCGRPASRPPSLSASGPISVTPRSSHPTDSSRSAARAVRERADVHARASHRPGACASSLRTVLDESVPTRAQRVDLWATPTHVRHGCHRRPVAAAHSPCLSRPPERMWMDGRGPWPPERRTRVHGPTRHDSANPPRRPPARRHRPRVHSALKGRPWGTSSTPTSRTTTSGSSGPTAPPAAGPPISPRSSAATRGPPP